MWFTIHIFLSLFIPYYCVPLRLLLLHSVVLFMRFDMVWWDGTWPALHCIINIYHWGAHAHRHTHTHTHRHTHRTHHLFSKTLDWFFWVCVCVYVRLACVASEQRGDSLLGVLTPLQSTSTIFSPPPLPSPLLLYVLLVIGTGRELNGKPHPINSLMSPCSPFSFSSSFFICLWITLFSDV